MSHKLRRRLSRALRRQNGPGRGQESVLRLETLEQRLLLDVAGYWDELGWRSATGGGTSLDEGTEAGEAHLVLSQDGDPMLFWTEGTFNEYIETPIPFYWEVEGNIYARQYAGATGWWDLTPGSGDTVAIGTGRQMDAAAGPDGLMAVAWISGTDPASEVYVCRWDGTQWLPAENISNDGVLNENPSIAINGAGEVFVSYTALHPVTMQREIVVQKYGYHYAIQVQGAPTSADLGWVEVVSAEVEPFGLNDLSGVSHDSANSYDSAIAVDRAGRPIVAWTSQSGENSPEIYLERWNGTDWMELGMGSASDLDGDGQSGVSNNPGFSLQPDVAVAANGDVIVAWVDWADWYNYDNHDTAGGLAGVFVRVLRAGATTWDEYQTGVSARGAGIAPSQGWYYSPQIAATSQGYPFVVWQGFGAGERYVINRDYDLGTPPWTDTGLESPIMAVYGSAYAPAGGFRLLPSQTDPTDTRANPYSVISGLAVTSPCWMPAAVVAPNDQLVMAFMWRDIPINPGHLDSEIFVQKWDAAAHDWVGYGRSSNANGNDVFGGPVNSAGPYDPGSRLYREGNVQLALIDYDNKASTEEDVLLANGQHVYLYNRQTGAWSLLDPPGGYGRVFNLKGEPEVEFNIPGNPLLGYVDTNPFSATYRLPFVLEYRGGSWVKVGNGPAATARLANTPYDGVPAGISVQTGPNGSVLLVYLGFDGVCGQAYTRLWNGITWQDTGPDGKTLEDPPLQAVFYADLDGDDFISADLTEVQITNGKRTPGYDAYEPGKWYWDNLLTPTDLRDGVTAGVDDTAGPYYVPGDQQAGTQDVADPALVISLVIPEDESPGFDDGTGLYGLADYAFQLIGPGYVIVELTYAAETLNMDGDLYLALDGVRLDADPNDDLPFTPIVQLRPGFFRGWDQGDATTITFDSKAVLSEPLAAGPHRLALFAVATVTCPDLGPDLQDSDRLFSFPVDQPNLGGGWTFAPDPIDDTGTVAAWSADAGDEGVGDGGLQIDLSDAGGQDSYTGALVKAFGMLAGDDVFVEFPFDFDVGPVGAGDSVEMTVELVTPSGQVVQLSEPDAYLFTNAQHLLYDDPVSFDTTAIPLADKLLWGSGLYTVRIVLALDNANTGAATTATLMLDDIRLRATPRDPVTTSFDTDPYMEGWWYDDLADPDDRVNGGFAPGDPTGTLQMILGDGANADSGLGGEFGYDFAYGGPVTIQFDYVLTVGASVPANETLHLMVAIDGRYITRDQPDDAYPTGDPLLDLDYIVVTADGAAEQTDEGSFDVTLEGLGGVLPELDALASGPHTITIEAWLSNSAAAGDGIGTAVIDNFRLFGIDTDAADLGLPADAQLPDWMVADPHRFQVRADNAAVYQRIVPDQSNHSLDEAFTFTAVGLPAHWSYVDPPGPKAPHVSGGQDADSGRLGEDDGGLLMTLGNNVNAVAGLFGDFRYTFDLPDFGFVSLGLSYDLQIGGAIPAYTPLDLIVSLAGPGGNITLWQDEITASGGGTRDSGWQTIEFNYVPDGQALWPGTYSLVLTARLATSADGDGVPAAGQGIVRIDNVSVEVFPGSSHWEMPAKEPLVGGDTGADISPAASLWGSNDAVGPDPNANDLNREGAFDFNACLRGTADGAGSTQRFLIEDLQQYKTGKMLLGFRYRADFLPSIHLYVDDQEYVPEGKTVAITPTIWSGWWDYNQKKPKYAWAKVQIPNVESTILTDQPHTLAIEFDSPGQLYIDNVVVLASQITHAMRPMATLLSDTVGNQRAFGVSVVSWSPTLLVYENTDDPFVRWPIESAELEIPSGYATAAVMALDLPNNAWRQYGTQLSATSDLPLFRDVANKPLPNATAPVPEGEVYYLQDSVVAENGVVWVALQHATADWVDADPKVPGNDLAVIHPFLWTDPPDYWHDPTLLDLAVWRWDPQISPFDPAAQQQTGWRDTGFAPRTTSTAYTHVQLVGSGGQRPTVAWTNRGPWREFAGAYAQHYEGNGVWGLLNTESTQNNQFWSALVVRDMVIRRDGFPVISFYAGHLYSDAVREFRRGSTIASLLISEASDLPNDNRLDFGQVQTVPVIQSFSIANNSTGTANLTIYGIDFGGYGNLAANPFSLVSAPRFPVVLAPGAAVGFGVRFDPTGVPPGRYQAVAVVHTDAAASPTHPTGHFQEIFLDIEVPVQGEIAVAPGPAQTPSYLNFPDTVIGNTSLVRPVVVRNIGTGDLRIDQWLFGGDNFVIAAAAVTRVLPDGRIVTDSWPHAANTAAGDDDLVLAAQSYLTLDVVFRPDLLGIFNDTLLIHSNDSDEPFSAVSMTGLAISGAALVVEENSGAPNDDLLEFGSVLMGTASSPLPLLIRNAGHTNLTISGISLEGPFQLQVPFQNAVTLVPGQTFQTSVIFYAPVAPGELEGVDNTGRLLIVNDSPNQTYYVDLQGLAVPKAPLIQITEASGVANDDLLDFGTVSAGQVASQQFVIENIGGDNLTITRISIPTAQSPFQFVPQNPALVDWPIVLAPGEKQPFLVTFHPTQAGQVQDSLNIYNNDGNHQTYQIRLRGAAVQTLLSVTDSVAPADDQKVDFGPVGQGAGSLQTVTLTNLGASPVTVTGWQITAGAGYFTVDPPFTGNVVLAAQGARPLNIRFAPAVVGSFTGVLTITSDDAAHPIWQVTLLGQGVGPGAVGLTDSDPTTPEGRIHFATALGTPLIVGFDTAAAQLVISNVGQSNIAVKSITLTAADGSLLTNAPFALTIPGRPDGVAPNNPADDVVLAPQGSLDSRLTVAIVFAPMNPFDGQVYVRIVSNISGGAGADTVANAILTGQSVFALTTGLVAGHNLSPAGFYDADNDWVTVRVSGGGYATVVLTNGMGNGGDIARIDLYETTPKTALTVTSSGRTNLGYLIGGAVKNVTLKGVTLDGQGLAGDAINLQSLAGALTVTQIVNGADITIGAAGNRGAKFKLGAVGDGSDLAVAGDIALLQAESFGTGVIEARNLAKLSLGGGSFRAAVHTTQNLGQALFKSLEIDANFRVGGDLGKLSAPLAGFTGTLQAGNIGPIKFARLSGADIAARGSLASLTVADTITGSRVLAGYDLDTAALFNGGSIGGVKVGSLFADSVLAAGVAPYSDAGFFAPGFANAVESGVMGRVQFGAVLLDNNGKLFGVAAHSAIAQVQIAGETFRPDAQIDDFVLRLI